MGIQTKVVLHFPGRRTKQRASKVNNDLVIPFNYLDNLKAWRIGISVNTFRFNARMDAEKLRAALQHLYEKDGWKKLGARVRKTRDVRTRDFLRRRENSMYPYVYNRRQAI